MSDAAEQQIATVLARLEENTSTAVRRIAVRHRDRSTATTRLIWPKPLWMLDVSIIPEKEPMDMTDTKSVAEAEIAAILKKLEEETGTPGFSERYANFVVVAANHMETLAPFIPALTQLGG